MKQLHNFISILNLSLKAGHFFFKCKKTKFTLQLVQLLIRYCYFIGYKVCSHNKDSLLIFFKLTLNCTQPLMVTCHLVKSGNPTYLKWTSNWAQTSSVLLILSTSKGLVTQKEAFQKKLGGRLLLKIT